MDGTTYDDARDGARLKSLLARVRGLMLDGQWRTLADIARATGGSEASVSARLRDLRKERFGGLNVEREHIGRGLWRYRVAPPAQTDIEDDAPSDQTEFFFSAEG